MVKFEDFVIPAALLGGLFLISREFRQGIGQVGSGVGDAFSGLGGGIGTAGAGLGSGIGKIGESIGGFIEPLGTLGTQTSLTIEAAGEEQRKLRRITFPIKEAATIKRVTAVERFKTELTKTVTNPLEAFLRARATVEKAIGSKFSGVFTTSAPPRGAEIVTPVEAEKTFKPQIQSEPTSSGRSRSLRKSEKTTIAVQPKTLLTSKVRTLRNVTSKETIRSGEEGRGIKGFFGRIGSRIRKILF